MESNDKKRQLYERLERLISCPKCEKRLNINNYMCGNGHTICKICTDGAILCSLCQAPYTSIQNLFAQNLLSQFDDIKECLTLELNNTQLKSNKSIDNIEKKCDLPTNSKEELTSGQYRCWITNECKFIGHYSSIIKHLKTFHVADYFEFLEGNLPYSNSWIMKYSIGNDFNRAYNIGGLLFIVHISINEDEDLCACIIIYTGHSLAFRHSCRIEIECNDEKLSYKKGKVLSAQSSEDIILQLKRNIIHITHNKPLYNVLKRKLRFKCSILIEKRVNELVTDGKKRLITTNDHPRAVKSINKQQSTVTNCKLPIASKPNLKINDNQRHPITPMKKFMGNSNESTLFQNVRPHDRSYVHNQQLYPNLGNSLNVNNYMPSLSMVNNNANAPSAPLMYERPPPINPYFNDYRASINTNVAEASATSPEENTEKCILS